MYRYYGDRYGWVDDGDDEDEYELDDQERRKLLEGFRAYLSSLSERELSWLDQAVEGRELKDFLKVDPQQMTIPGLGVVL